MRQPKKEKRKMPQNVLGVIGGSGFYQMKGLDKVELMELETPFGRPSDPFYQGRIGDVEVVFLARHGRGHRLLPSEINFRANVFGMKQLGVTHLVSVSTAGSLKEEIRPGDLMIPDQFIDRTFKRPGTFFGDGLVVHVSLADPVCADLARALGNQPRTCGCDHALNGTIITERGAIPQRLIDDLRPLVGKYL